MTRAHLEEDAGKSVMRDLGVQIRIDYNRARLLLEIVSEPSMSSTDEAVAYAKSLHNLVTWIGICDGNMQEVHSEWTLMFPLNQRTEALGTRCEIKI